MLGPTDPAVNLDSLGALHVGTYDKTLFSMLTTEVLDFLSTRPDAKSIALMGIESHICVLQTALALNTLPKKYTTYVLADAVSSSNPAEVPLALLVHIIFVDPYLTIPLFRAQMRAAGVIVTTSESLAFQLIHDASTPEFKAFSNIIKEEKEATAKAVAALLGRV